MAAPASTLFSDVVATAAHSPTVLAFAIAGDSNHIHVGYAPSLFPGDLAVSTPFDDQVVVLVGDDLTLAVTIALPDNAFTRTAAARCFDMDSILGPAGHGHGPAVFMHGPHAGGAPNTMEIRARRVFLMPATDAVACLTTQPAGRYTLAAFHAGFVAPGMASADGLVVTATEPIRDWWRCASTLTAPGTSLLKIIPIVSGAPHLVQRMNAWVSRIRNTELAKLGAGGPSLTTAAFTTGITSVTDTLELTNREQLRFQRDRDLKTFTQKHGTALAERMHNWWAVADDEHLPEVHILLAKSTKNRD